MPTSIPYDPSLVLGNIVDPNLLDNLIKISEAQAPIDNAQDYMNSLISMKYSVEMTIQELLNLNVDTQVLLEKNQELSQRITKAAADYITKKMTGEEQVQTLKQAVHTVHKSFESPIDYMGTSIKTMPLSADSIKLDCQYFSFDQNEQKAQNTISSIKSYITGQVDFFGDREAANVSGSATQQINNQRERHDISGTLVISATCTHQNAVLLAPFIINVDKAIRVWNSIYTADEDKIKVNDITNIAKIAQEEGTDKEKFLSIISGATYGSCFVGMVHILRRASTQSSQNIISTAASLQDSFSVGGWFADYSGNIGVDSSFANDIKNLLSRQEVASHANMITMGVIPTIKSNELQTAVKTFSGFDPSEMGNKLATLANQSQNDVSTIASSAEEARTGGKMVAIRGAEIKSMMTGLGELDKENNQVIDTNSMMSAFDDYINKISQGTSDSQVVGVPINYYIKNISRAQLAQMWMSKYYPDRYLAISGDDSVSESSK